MPATRTRSWATRSTARSSVRMRGASSSGAKWPSLRQQTHRLFESLDRQRVHALVHQLLHDADRLAVLPHALRLGVDPHEFREGARQPLDPLDAGFLVVVFDAAAGL